MQLIGGAPGVVFVLVVAWLIASVGALNLMRARRRGRHVMLLPWWYQGGQPDIPGPGGDRRSRRGR